MMAKKLNKKGFTLLELLLVVLVVGILASLAMPQYTMITEKARSAEAFSMIGAIKTAQEMYKLETGANYASVITDLKSLVTPPPDGATYWDYTTSNTAGTSFTVTAKRTVRKAPVDKIGKTLILVYTPNPAAGNPTEVWTTGTYDEVEPK